MAKPLFTARSKEAENIPNTKKMENDIFVVLWQVVEVQYYELTQSLDYNS